LLVTNLFQLQRSHTKELDKHIIKLRGLGRFNHLIESATGEIVEKHELSGVKLEPQNWNKTALLIFQLTLS